MAISFAKLHFAEPYSAVSRVNSSTEFHSGPFFREATVLSPSQFRVKSKGSSLSGSICVHLWLLFEFCATI